MSKFRLCKSKELIHSSDLRVAENPLIAASSTWIAYSAQTSGNYSQVALLPVVKEEINGVKTKKENFFISAHADVLGDLQFSPFNANKLATGGKDAVVKLWEIPSNGLEENMSKSLMKVDVDGVVNQVKFHPSAEHVMVTSTNKSVALIDVVKGEIVSSNQMDALGCTFSLDGSVVAVPLKDGSVKQFDPRAPNAAILPVKIKAEKVYTSKDGFVFVGTNSMRQASFCKSGTEAEALDSLGSGVFMTQYDLDTGLLFAANRSSTAIHTFDTSGDRISRVDSCSVKLLSGFCIYPKWSNDIMGNEIARLYKVSTAGHVGVISSTVERKLRQFHGDLFPDTSSNKPCLKHEDYFLGKNSFPFFMTPDPSKGLFHRSENINIIEEEAKIEINLKAKAVEASRKEELAILELKSDARVKIDSALKQAKFRIVTGKEPLVQSLNEYYYGIQSSVHSINLGRNIISNEKVFVTPWKTLGGSALLIHPLDKMGRLPDSPTLVRGHSAPISTFDIQGDILATGASDAHVMCWNLCGKSGDITSSDLDLRSDGKVSTLKFHPFVNGLLGVSQFAFDSCNVLCYDINGHNKSPIVNIPCSKELIMDLQWNSIGSAMAVSSKDGNFSILDPRKPTVASVVSCLESYNNCSLHSFDNNDNLWLAVGSSKSHRSTSVYDIRSNKALSSYQIDGSNSCPLPYFDVNLGLLYLASVGERTMSVLQVDSTSSNMFEMMTTFQSAEIITGLCARSKNTIDTKNAAVSHFLALTRRETVTPINFRMPRKRLDYFQDDLYPDVLPLFSSKEACSAANFFAGKYIPPPKIKLNKLRLPLLSEAPPEELTQRQLNAIKTKQEQMLQEKEAAQFVNKTGGGLGMKSQDEVIDHFRGLQTQGYVPKSSRWDAKPDSKNEVADDEWD